MVRGKPRKQFIKQNSCGCESKQLQQDDVGKKVLEVIRSRCLPVKKRDEEGNRFVDIMEIK